MKCVKCGFEDEGKFCSNCGLLLQELPTVKPELPAIPPNSVEWQVCISFGKSISANFERALYLAKVAPRYLETVDEVGRTIYQAFFGENQYIQFINLYELIGSWKSCFVFINNEMVDRKIIGNINYCFGDKIRSGNPNFCFGASTWTENPFGCHRAQIHRGNSPWYTFGMIDTVGIFHVDVEKIVEELGIRLIPYRYCPALKIDDILNKASGLPRTINPNKQNEWEYATHYYADGSQHQGVQPKSDSISYEIKISLDDVVQNQEPSKTIDEGKTPKKKAGFLSKLFGD